MCKQAKVLAAALGMLVLILDSNTARSGAVQGIQVCLETVIPSIFPFLILSGILNGALGSASMTRLQPLARVLKVPENALPILIVGMLGGYPIGAQLAAQAARQGQLSRQDARRMLAFCSNAGPAFLFGIGAHLFPDVGLCFVIWWIQLASSAAVALLTPCAGTLSAGNHTNRVPTLPQALHKALQVMASICGWVVIFRVIIAYCQRWVLWALPKEIEILLTGLLELANGCCALTLLEPLGLRLTAFAFLLSFGGLCVWIQTISVCNGLETDRYFPGKFCQAAMSVLLSVPAQLLLPCSQRWYPGIAPLVVCLTVCGVYHISCRKSKKAVAFSNLSWYNAGNST